MSSVSKIKLPDNTVVDIADKISGYGKFVHLTDEGNMPASPDAGTLYLIDDDGDVFVSTSQQSLTSSQQAQARTNINAPDASVTPKYVLLADEAAYSALATKDSGTLYLIPKTS